jgi:hypothetical protein
MGTSFEDIPSTPVPELRRFDHISAASGVTAVPLDEELAYDPSQTDSDGSSYEDDPSVKPDTAEMVVAPSMQPPEPQPAQQKPAEPQQQAQPQQPPKKPPARRRSPVVPILVASLALLTAMGGVVFLLLPTGGETTDEQIARLEIEDPFAEPMPTPTPSAAATDGNDGAADVEPEPDAPDPEPEPDAPDPEPEPEPDAPDPEADVADPTLPLFKPELPKAPRRLPHRPQKFTHPPPGGPLQFQAVDASRRRDCPAALAAVQKGMREVSIDHATLYKGAWFCFNEAYQRRLEQAEAVTWDDFTYQLPHFEGPPETKAAAIRENKDLEKLPSWYRPAVGGLGYRLEQFSADPQMDEVLVDLFGEPTIADHLAKDLHMEALAAVGLSRIPPDDREPVMEEAWARRVYVLASALKGRPGRLLDAHRRELIPELRALLDEATTQRMGPDGDLREVPKMVLEARQVAEGNLPPPTQKKITAPKPVDPRLLEPDLGEEETIEVNRAGG